MRDVAALRRLAWTHGVPALAAVALFNVSAGGPHLLSTHGSGAWFDRYAAVALVVPPAAVVAGVWNGGRWPWLLVAGAVLKLPEAVWSHTFFLGDRPGVTRLVWAAGTAGTALIVLGVLAAVMSARQGAALAGWVVGVLLVGSTLLGLEWLDTPERSAVVDYGLAGAGVLAGALAVFGARTGRLPRDHVPISRRAAVVGTGAAVLPLLLAVTGYALHEVTAEVPAVSGAGLVALLCAAGLAVSIGSVLRALAAGLVLFAVAAPLTLGVYFSSGQIGAVWLPAFAGLLLGVVVGRTRFGGLLAVAATAFVGVTMATAGPVTGSYVEMATGEPLIVPAAVLIGAAVAAATSTAATVAPFLLRHQALPVVLGPLLMGVVLACRALLQVVLQYDGAGTALPEASRTSVWATLLGIAAVLLAVIAFLDRRQPRIDTLTEADAPDMSALRDL